MTDPNGLSGVTDPGHAPMQQGASAAPIPQPPLQVRACDPRSLPAALICSRVPGQRSPGIFAHLFMTIGCDKRAHALSSAFASCHSSLLLLTPSFEGGPLLRGCIWH